MEKAGSEAWKVELMEENLNGTENMTIGNTGERITKKKGNEVQLWNVWNCEAE